MDVGFLTPAGIMAGIAIISSAVAIFLYFRKPQEEIETKLAIGDKELANKATLLAQKEMENKAALLAQQVESEKILNEKRFTEMGKRLDDAILAVNTHVHSVDGKVSILTETVNNMNLSLMVKMEQLSTIISERIPPKTN